MGDRLRTLVFVALVGCSGTDDPFVPAPDAGESLDMPVVGDDGSRSRDLGADAAPDLPTADDMPVYFPCSTGTRDGECRQVDDCGGTRESVPGFCPGPTEIQCCVEIAAGECVENPSWDEMPRPNFGLTEAPGIGGCPDGMRPVDAFCIDTYEAALVEILPDGSERSWSPYFNPAGARVYAVSIEGAVPQGYINGDQAGAACAEAGKRLCTDAEWLRACQGPNGTTYPYGATRQDGVCNDARAVHPAVEYFGSSDPSVFSMIDNACLNQLDDGLARTGAHPGCVTAEGAFDMMGNLHEWTADPAGTFRGGFYVDTVRNGEGCLYRTTAHTTPHWDYSTGFRCCAP